MWRGVATQVRTHRTHGTQKICRLRQDATSPDQTQDLFLLMCLVYGWAGAGAGTEAGNGEKDIVPQAVEWGGAGKVPEACVFQVPVCPVMNSRSIGHSMKAINAMSHQIPIGHPPPEALVEPVP